ncbi:ammonium transporter [Humisphaera borealis]|uniref:Ammonium transporter AmtB-like domain-containing protein n=1 Tax=Humisphaera borealis TaxID=2807512 RepID=A0A7M2WY72_9BACT|nr:hypothetical protein [Humisphaera borealis]QOV90304.1 hypothetical protein IPV69_02720 [Humisphaera borealis]
MSAFILISILLVRVGLGMYLAGLTRAKNAAGVVARVICDFGIAALAFYVLGAAIVTQENNRIFAMDFRHWFNAEAAAEVSVFLLFTTVATGIVIGALGERSRFFAMLPVTIVLAAVVVPVLAFWSRSSLGWLARLSVIDDFGASWLHMAGGVFALFGAKAVGARSNKYHRDGSASIIPGHSVPLAGLGALIMFAGLASLLAAGGGRAALNGVLAGAAGIVASLVLGRLRYGKPDVLLMITGMLGGVVAISAGAANVYPIFAIIIGGGAGVLVPWAAVEIDMRLRIDDPAGAVAIHLVGGAWGTVCAGIFCGRGVGGTFQAIGVQLLALVVAVAVSAAAAFGVFKFLASNLRSNEADEFDGLDLAEHDIGAYPDFQQNSIRSYHLREA